MGINITILADQLESYSGDIPSDPSINIQKLSDQMPMGERPVYLVVASSLPNQNIPYSGPFPNDLFIPFSIVGGSLPNQNDIYVFSISIYSETITETLMIYDQLQWVWVLTPEDGGSTAAITDVEEIVPVLKINEWIEVEETLTNNWTGTETVNEISMAYETLLFGWMKELTSEASIAETLTIKSIWKIIEYLTVRDTVTANWTGTELITSFMNLKDSIAIVWPLIAESTSAITDTSILETIYKIQEFIDTQDTVVSNWTGAEAIESLISIRDAIAIVWPLIAESTSAITDTTVLETIYKIQEFLNVVDIVVSQWSGTESVTSTLSLFGQAMIAQLFDESVTSTAAAVEVITHLHQMVCAVESTFASADSASTQVDFDPVITESIAITGLLSVIHKLNLSISESGEIVDSLGFAWMDALSETFAIVDAAALQRTAMIILTESLAATETALGLFNFTDTVTETLEAIAAITLQQILTETVTETIKFRITVQLNGETYECWVLNGNKFDMSVYSGFEFNSYAVFEGIAYACKSDGIYKLSGTTDDGAAFKSGVVLPETDWGTSHNKRFRKGYFSISGSAPKVRLETETGSITYDIVSSKSNLSRSQKGIEWVLKVSEFDDLSSIDLVPIILTRG